MSHFTIHNFDTASAEGAQVLERAEATWGMVPNLVGVLAEAPSAAGAYLDLNDAFAASSLTPVEQQVVALTASHQNGCSYCMAAESTVAAMVGADSATLEALREGRPLPAERLDALSRFTREVVESRGWVGEAELGSFLSAGFTRAQVLEVVLGVTKKTLSNYANHITATPLDAAFEGNRWSQSEPVAAGV
jgi:AhpD family alkylhydroperoxidase